MRSNEKPIFALDLGTTKFCVATLAKSGDGESFKIDTVSIPAQGMRRGMVANFNEARAALTTLIDLAERQFNADIHSVAVGIAGSHLRGHSISTAHMLSRRLVDAVEMAALQHKIARDFAAPQREILHILPMSYRVDDRPATADPLGISGHTLSCQAFVLDSDQAYLKDILQLCNESGVVVSKFYSEAVASSTVTLPPHLQELGAAVLDIGGGTSDGIIYIAGHPASIFTVNIAGIMMTKDLAIGLHLPVEEAEKLKLRFGLNGNVAEPIRAVDHFGTQVPVSPSALKLILEARLNELARAIGRHIEPAKRFLGGGLLITGGGSEVLGIENFLANTLQIPVSRVFPKQDFHSSATFATKFATALGLLYLQLQSTSDAASRATVRSRFLGRMVQWLRELS